MKRTFYTDAYFCTDSRRPGRQRFFKFGEISSRRGHGRPDCVQTVLVARKFKLAPRWYTRVHVAIYSA